MILDIFYCFDFSCLSISRNYLLSCLLYQIYAGLSNIFLLSYIHIICFIYFFQTPVICLFLLLLLSLPLFTFYLFIFIPDTRRYIIKQSASHHHQKKTNFFFFIFHLFLIIPIFLSTFNTSHQAAACGRVLTWILANQRPRKVQVQ